MKVALVIHKEDAVEYYKDGELIFPSWQDKLLYTLFGTPEGIEMREQHFETKVDVIRGKSLKEVEKQYRERIDKGEYNFVLNKEELSLQIN